MGGSPAEHHPTPQREEPDILKVQLSATCSRLAFRPGREDLRVGSHHRMATGPCGMAPALNGGSGSLAGLGSGARRLHRLHLPLGNGTGYHWTVARCCTLTRSADRMTAAKSLYVDDQGKYWYWDSTKWLFRESGEWQHHAGTGPTSLRAPGQDDLPVEPNQAPPGFYKTSDGHWYPVETADPQAAGTRPAAMIPTRAARPELRTMAESPHQVNPFCWACGRSLVGAACECGTPNDPPFDPLDPKVGLNVQVRRNLRKQQGLIVGKVGATKYLVMFEESVSEEKVEEEDLIEDNLTPLHRLLLFSQSAESQIISSILNEAMSQVGAKRALALSGFQANDQHIIDAAGLSEFETSWMSMWRAHNAGSRDEVLTFLSQLPSDRYPDKVGIAMAWFTQCTPDERISLADLLSQIDHPASQLLATATGQGGVPTMVTGAIGVEFYPPVSMLIERDLSVLDGDLALAPSASRQVQIVAGLKLGSFSGEYEANDFEAWTESAIDEAIDTGVTIPWEQLGQLPGDHVYWMSRLDPSRLSDSELQDIGVGSELARRALLAGHAAELQELDGEDEVVRRLQLLSRLKEGDVSITSELLALLAGNDRKTAAAVAQSLHTGQVIPEAVEDESTWPVLVDIAPRGSDREHLPRGVQALGEFAALIRAKEALFSADWNAAAEWAVDCLATAEEPKIRGEALNSLACAHLMRGNADQAAQALWQVVEGADIPAASVNYGIALGEYDIETAIGALASLASKDVDLDLRVNAAIKALVLWSSRERPSDADNDLVPWPLTNAMRALSTLGTTLEQHVEVMEFLCSSDSAWVASPSNTARSPHASTPIHRYLGVRAKDFDAGVPLLGELLRSNPTDQFLRVERDKLIDAAMGLMTGTESAIAAGILSLTMVDSGLPMSPENRALLESLAVREIAIGLQPGEGEEPTSLKMDLFHRVISIRSRLDTFDKADRERIGFYCGSAVQAFAITSVFGWDHELNMIADAYNDIIEEVSGIPRRRLNMDAVHSNISRVVSALVEVRTSCSAVLKALPEDAPDSLREMMTNVIDRSTDMSRVAKSALK